MVFAAHDDRFFRAGVDAKAAIDTAHHIDVEPCWIFLDLRIRVLACFDIDALGGTNRRAHVARNAFKTAIIAHSQNMRATKSFGIWPRFFGVVDRWYITLKKTGEQPAEGDCKGAKRRPDGGVLPPRPLAGVDRRNLD